MFCDGTSHRRSRPCASPGHCRRSRFQARPDRVRATEWRHERGLPHNVAGAENPLVLKIYADEPAWIVAKEALVAGWIGEQAGLPIPQWLRVDERRTRIPYRFALTTWLPGVTVRSLIGAPHIDAVYRQMGALLRRLHGIAMPAYGYIVADGIRRPQPTNDDYMRIAFSQVFRQFREQGGEDSLAHRLEDKSQSRFHLVRRSNRPHAASEQEQTRLPITAATTPAARRPQPHMQGRQLARSIVRPASIFPRGQGVTKVQSKARS